MSRYRLIQFVLFYPHSSSSFEVAAIFWVVILMTFTCALKMVRLLSRNFITISMICPMTSDQTLRHNVEYLINRISNNCVEKGITFSGSPCIVMLFSCRPYRVAEASGLKLVMNDDADVKVDARVTVDDVTQRTRDKNNIAVSPRRRRRVPRHWTPSLSLSSAGRDSDAETNERLNRTGQFYYAIIAASGSRGRTARRTRWYDLGLQTVACRRTVHLLDTGTTAASSSPSSIVNAIASDLYARSFEKWGTRELYCTMTSNSETLPFGTVPTTDCPNTLQLSK